MTITAVQVFEPVEISTKLPHRSTPKPPPQVWQASEPPFKGYTPAPSDGYAKSSPSTAIVIDNGSSLLRAGWSFDKAPRVSIPANVARYRDRKLNRTCMYVGWDTYADATTRGQIRNAFEPGTGLVTNWDIMEGVLDYTFLRLGIEGSEGGIGRPVVMTEPVANLSYSRRSGYKILFGEL
ncbi:MAG: hypothetical protein LQ340_004475 [Diploschistes diacapsis]|nr:MAG: hypothetical protein LQ340_004475 [Diploschistes diacapsis]